MSYEYDPSKYPGHFVDFRQVQWDQPRINPIDIDEDLVSPIEVYTPPTQEPSHLQMPRAAKSSKAITTRKQDRSHTRTVSKINGWFRDLRQRIDGSPSFLPKHPYFSHEEVLWIGHKVSAYSRYSVHVQRAYSNAFPNLPLEPRRLDALKVSFQLLSSLTGRERERFLSLPRARRFRELRFNSGKWMGYQNSYVSRTLSNIIRNSMRAS